MQISTVGIVGSGIMGGGIAEVAATAGHQVVLRSRTAEAAEAMRASVAKNLERQVAKEKRTAEEAAEILGRISTTTSLAELAACDLILESVVEDLEVKLDLFRQLDELAKPEAIVATNTSTLSVTAMAAATSRADRVLGIHFFNPAPAMSLVEVVRALTTSDEVAAAAHAFATTCGKQPVEVADRAGFVVNALLFPYLNNAVRLLEQGTATKEGIDEAMKGGCNFPMGPLALLDLVGLDTSVSILDALYAEFGDPNYRAVPLLRRMLEAGQLGRKSGRGFYDYA
jgi:3-hydroxybutyryl-CoA dehydrogenase